MEEHVSPQADSEPTEVFLRACWRLPVDHTPVWFMRQAGRYMAEYRAIRERYSLLEIIAQPDLAVEVTLQPVQSLGVDAAIVFKDILLPLIPIDLEYVKDKGPVIHNPVRTIQDISALRPIVPEDDLSNVMETIQILRQELPVAVPLIGFAGAPFTIASYMIEGGSSRHYLVTKSLMYSDPNTWHKLMDKIAQMTADYLVAQINAGAQVVQLFDSWVGALSPDDYRQYVLPHSTVVLKAASETGVPVIHFGTATATLLKAMHQAGGSVIGLDWRIMLDQAWDHLGHDVAVQGNLDPALLLAPMPVLEQRVVKILEQARGRPGHIFNLGHGVLPQTDVESVRAVVEIVHAYELHAASNGEA